MNILIAEDSSLELERIRRMVREAAPDAVIHAHRDSIEAEQEILSGSFRPDIAFLDIEMPAPTGTELAQLIRDRFGRVNIIYATAYTAYMHEALDQFVSGYLLKPFSQKDILKQLQNLRYPIEDDAPKGTYYARTLGEFDLFCNGKPVHFALARAKEALAYLICQNGASVTKRELFSILFEDKEYTPAQQDHMQKIMRSLKRTLSEIGAPGMLIHDRNSYAVDMEMLCIDQPDADDAYPARSYMQQYSWAEGWDLD